MVTRLLCMPADVLHHSGDRAAHHSSPQCSRLANLPLPVLDIPSRCQCHPSLHPQVLPTTCMHIRPSKAAFIKVGHRQQRRQHANCPHDRDIKTQTSNRVACFRCGWHGRLNLFLSIWHGCCRSGWLEFTHTASNYNITAAHDNLNSNFTGAVDTAIKTFDQTKGSLLQGGNPRLTVGTLPLSCEYQGLAAAHACRLSNLKSALDPVLVTDPALAATAGMQL